MGYYRGVPTLRTKRLIELAAKMRIYNLSHGTGCRSIEKAIQKREKAKGATQ